MDTEALAGAVAEPTKPTDGSERYDDGEPCSGDAACRAGWDQPVR
jgi:hypothetical protein